MGRRSTPCIFVRCANSSRRHSLSTCSATCGTSSVQCLTSIALQGSSWSGTKGRLTSIGYAQSGRALRLNKPSKRINSSNVPADFVAENAATDPRIVEEATKLYSELQKTLLPTKPFSAAADEMEGDFNRKVQHMMTVDDQLRDARRMVETLEKQCLGQKENIRG